MALRIAIVFPIDPTYSGGIQEHVVNLCRYLEGRGHFVEVIGPPGGEKYIDNYFGVGFTKHVPTPGFDWTDLYFLKKDDLEIVLKRLEEGKFDLLHVHGIQAPKAIWDILRKVDLPTVATFHSTWSSDSTTRLLHPIIKMYKKEFDELIDQVIYVSQASKDSWSILGLAESKQNIVYNGIDRRQFTPKVSKRDNNRVDILFLGRLVRPKGLHYLLQSVADLSNVYNNINLTVVGGGKTRKWFERLTRELGIVDIVTFTGDVGGAERVEFYLRSDIFCAPYSDEAFGITLLESLATGVPVVGFWNLGFESILDGYPARELFVEEGDQEALTRAIEKLVIDADLRHKLGLWGAKRAKEFDWQQIVKEIEEVYQKAVE